MDITEGSIYRHRTFAERRIQVMAVYPHRVKPLSRIRVEYISTTEKKNVGIKGTLTADFINRKYECESIGYKKPQWEV